MTYKDKRIFIDDDVRLNFEVNGRVRLFTDFFILPILNNLPIHFNKHIKKSNKAVHEVIENKTSHYALDILYDKGVTFSSETWLQKVFRHIWFTRNNPKGVRNRLSIVEREIRSSLLEKLALKEKVSVLSIASGSARAVIESVKKLDKKNCNKCHIYFFDKSSKALQYSKELFSDIDGVGHAHWIEDTANNFYKHIDTNIDIVEMVGLLDYFDDDNTVKTFKNIYNNLHEEGFFITANILPNNERKFITNVIGWNMIYRSPEELISLLEQAGFKKENIFVYVEPMRIHAIAVVKK